MGLNSLHNFTPADNKLISVTMLGFTMPGIFLSVVVLIAFAFAAWKPVSRPHLDRVSFRLLTYAIIANIFFGVAFILTAWLTGPSIGCSFVAFLTNTSLIFSASMFFSIALNLQLVIVHGVNGNAMEKYYLIGSTILSLALNIPPYALGQYGWNEENATCWYNTPSDAIRLRWVIGTLSFWVLFIACGETLMFFIVISYMLRCDRKTRSIRLPTQSSMVSAADSVGKNSISFATKYRKIILRIGLYPLISCIMNFSTVALDLYQTVDGVNTNLQFGLSIVDLCLYGLRLFFYAALAITDPSFLKAVRMIRNPTNLTSNTAVASSQATSQGQLTVHIELQQVKQTDDGAMVRRGNQIGAGKDKMDSSFLEGDVERKAAYPNSDHLGVVISDNVEEESEGARSFQRQI
jgi:hypothetical protein